MRPRAVLAILIGASAILAVGSPAAAAPAKQPSVEPRVPSSASEAQRPPSRLWYRLRVTYTARQGQITQQFPSPGIPLSFVQRIDYDVGATLRPRSSVLLRRRPGRGFSIVSGRPLEGTVTAWKRTIEAEAFGCTNLRETLTSIQRDKASANIGATPRGRRRVEIQVGGVGGLAGLAGGVAVRDQGAAWACNLDELQSAQLLVPPPYKGGRQLTPSGVRPPMFGDDDGFTQTRALSTRLIRPSGVMVEPKRFPILVNGVRFGARRFSRASNVFRTLNPPIQTGGSGTVTNVREKWTFAFTRCPRQRPC